MKRKRLAPLLHLIAILSLNFSHVFAAERPFDLSESEIQMLTQLGEHPDESMRYKLLNSRLREKSSLWEPFQEELDGLSEADYVSLRELIVEKSIVELQEAVN